MKTIRPKKLTKKQKEEIKAHIDESTSILVLANNGKVKNGGYIFLNGYASELLQLLVRLMSSNQGFKKATIKAIKEFNKLDIKKILKIFSIK